MGVFFLIPTSSSLFPFNIFHSSCLFQLHVSATLYTLYLYSFLLSVYIKNNEGFQTSKFRIFKGKLRLSSFCISLMFSISSLVKCFLFSRKLNFSCRDNCTNHRLYIYIYIHIIWSSVYHHLCSIYCKTFQYKLPLLQLFNLYNSSPFDPFMKHF